MLFGKKKKSTPAPAPAVNANDLQREYFQEYMSYSKQGQNEKAMESFIKHLYCNLAYIDNSFYFDISDKLSDEETISPVARKFLRENQNLYADSMVDACIDLPVPSPPSTDRVKALIRSVIE